MRNVMVVAIIGKEEDLMHVESYLQVGKNLLWRQEELGTEGTSDTAGR